MNQSNPGHLTSGTSNKGVVQFEGKVYFAKEVLLKTIHGKTGECTFSGFYEVKNDKNRKS